MINIIEGNRMIFQPLLTKDNNTVSIVEKFRERIRQEKYKLVNYILLVDGCPFLDHSIVCQKSSAEEVLLYISKTSEQQIQAKHKNIFLLLPMNQSYHYSLIASLWLLCKTLITEIQSIIEIFYPLFDDEEIQESIQETSPNSIFMIDTDADNPEIEFYNQSDEEVKIQINTFFPLKQFIHYPEDYAKQIDLLTEVTSQFSSKFSNQLDMSKSLIFFQMICQEINENRVIELPVFFDSLEEKVLKEVVNKSNKLFISQKSSIEQSNCSYIKALEIKRVIYNNICKEILDVNDMIPQIPTFQEDVGNYNLQHLYTPVHFQNLESFQKFSQEFYESVKRIKEYKPTQSKSYKEKLSTAIENNYNYNSQVQQPKCRFSELINMEVNISKIDKKQPENTSSAFKGVPTNQINVQKITSAQNLLPTLSTLQPKARKTNKQIIVNQIIIEQKSNCVDCQQQQQKTDCCKSILNKFGCVLF